MKAVSWTAAGRPCLAESAASAALEASRTPERRRPGRSGAAGPLEVGCAAEGGARQRVSAVPPSWPVCDEVRAQYESTASRTAEEIERHGTAANTVRLSTHVKVAACVVSLVPNIFTNAQTRPPHRHLSLLLNIEDGRLSFS